MFGQIGWPEALLFLLIILLIFGASRLREIGGAMGGAIREFRSAVSGADEEKGKGEKNGEGRLKSKQRNRRDASQGRACACPEVGVCLVFMSTA